MSEQGTTAATLKANPGELVVDTREPHPDSCATRAMGAFDELATGSSFLLVADHDPRGIRYMLVAERPEQSGWDLVQDGPELWQARVRREAAPA